MRTRTQVIREALQRELGIAKDQLYRAHLEQSRKREYVTEVLISKYQDEITELEDALRSVENQ